MVRIIANGAARYGTADKIAMREYDPPLCPAAGPDWGIPLDLIVAGTNG